MSANRVERLTAKERLEEGGFRRTRKPLLGVTWGRLGRTNISVISGGPGGREEEDQSKAGRRHGHFKYGGREGKKKGGVGG